MTTVQRAALLRAKAMRQLGKTTHTKEVAKSLQRSLQTQTR